MEGKYIIEIIISLHDETKAFVDSEIAAEGFATASEYLRSLVREAQRRRAKQALDAKLVEVLAEGPGTPMTAEEWASIEREALERLGHERAAV